MTTLKKQLKELENNDLQDGHCWTALAEILRQIMLAQGMDLDAKFEPKVKEREGNNGF